MQTKWAAASQDCSFCKQQTYLQTYFWVAANLSSSTGPKCLHFSVGRKVKSDQQDSPPLHSSKQQTSRFGPSLHRTSTQSTTLPVHPSISCARLAVVKSQSSSLSSLGEITASERRNSKLQSGSRRVLSQVSLKCKLYGWNKSRSAIPLTKQSSHQNV